jgi:hypothetical protein
MSKGLGKALGAFETPCCPKQTDDHVVEQLINGKEMGEPTSPPTIFCSFDNACYQLSGKRAIDRPHGFLTSIFLSLFCLADRPNN